MSELTIMEALEITTREVKEYADDKIIAPNWDTNNTSKNDHILNRPLWLEKHTITWSGQPTNISHDIEPGMTAYRISEHTPSGYDLVGSTINIQYGTSQDSYYIRSYCKTNAELENAIVEDFSKGYRVIVVSGPILGLKTDECAICYIDGENILPLAFVLSSTLENKGLYTVNLEFVLEGGYSYQIYMTQLTYTGVDVDDRYMGFFKTVGGANVYVLDANTSDVTAIDFSAYSAGDVVLVTMPSEGGLI